MKLKKISVSAQPIYAKLKNMPIDVTLFDVSGFGESYHATGIARLLTITRPLPSGAVFKRIALVNEYQTKDGVRFFN